MNAIANEIKTIAEGLGMVYFRSVNINDLNEQVGETNLEGETLCVYANTPVINNEVLQGGGVLMQYQIEVYFLQLNVGTDDNGTQIDVILDATKILADSFYDVLKKSALLQGFIEAYELEAAETLKLTKEVLTGWRMEATLPIDRTEYYCPPIPPPVPTSTTFTNIALDSIEPNSLRVFAPVDFLDIFQIGDFVNVKSDDLTYDVDGVFVAIRGSVNMNVSAFFTGNAGTGTITFLYRP